jgi:hypothetical protein
MQHDNRLICDNEVYMDNLYIQTLNIEEDGIRSGLVINDETLIFGMSKYGVVIPFDWDKENQIYRQQNRKVLKHYSPKCRTFDTRSLQLHDDRVYCITKTQLLKFHKNLDFTVYQKDYHRLKHEVIFTNILTLIDYQMAKDLIHLVILKSDNSVHVIDQFTGDKKVIY